MSKIIFMKSTQTGPKIKSTLNLLKFGTLHISNISISILMSEIIFIKYLPPVWPKLAPILKVIRIYWNLAHSIFQNANLDFNVKNIFIQYLPPFRPKLVAKFKSPEFIKVWHIWYSNNVNLNFKVKNNFLSNICQLLGLNWSQNEKRAEFI